MRSHFEATIEVNGVAYADLLAKDGAISTIIGAGSIGAARLIGKVCNGMEEIFIYIDIDGYGSNLSSYMIYIYISRLGGSGPSIRVASNRV